MKTRGKRHGVDSGETPSKRGRRDEGEANLTLKNEVQFPFDAYNFELSILIAMMLYTWFVFYNSS
jgi:hypothetical protein